MNTAIIDAVRKRLTESIDGKVLAASAHFFKEGEQAKVYGVRMGEVSAFISYIGIWEIQYITKT